MSGKQSARHLLPREGGYSRSICAPKSGHPVSGRSLTTSEYASTLAEVLVRQYGDSRSAAKRLSASVGAGIGTIRKWFAGEHGAHGVHLIKLMADDDEVFRAVCEMAGRGEAADAALALAKLREMKKLLEGIQ